MHINQFKGVSLLRLCFRSVREAHFSVRLPEQDLNKGEMKSDASLEWESAVGLILRKEKNLKAGEISAVKDKGTEFEREQNEYM